MSDLHTYKVMQEGDGDGKQPRPAFGWQAALISILLLLVGAAILYPVFFSPPDRGHRQHPLSNMKQLSLANLMYAYDYDEHLPPAETWMDVIEPYHKNTMIPQDPTIKDRKEQEYGFAFFEPVAGADLNAMSNVPDVPMIFQSALMGKNAHSDLRTLPYLPRNENGLNYVAFCDGHTKGLPPTWPGKPIVILTKKGEE